MIGLEKLEDTMLLFLVFEVWVCDRVIDMYSNGYN